MNKLNKRAEILQARWLQRSRDTETEYEFGRQRNGQSCGCSRFPPGIKEQKLTF